MTPPMTPTPAASAKEKAREIIKTAIRHGCADELNGNPCGDILVKGCTAAEYVHPEDAAEMFVECIADEVLAALSATEGEAEPVACTYCGDTGTITDRVDGEITCPECGYASPPSAPAGVKELLDRVRVDIVLALSFLARDLGTDRLRDTANSVIARLVAADNAIRSSLQPDTLAARCEYCDGTGDVHSIDGEWRGRCTCSAGSPDTQAAAASAPAQAEALPAGVDGDPHRFAVISADLCAAGVDVREALKTILDHVDVETCVHEETHRGGFLWTICDQCGRRWADDEGGFVPHADAPAVARARMICEALPTPDAKGSATKAERDGYQTKLHWVRAYRAKTGAPLRLAMQAYEDDKPCGPAPDAKGER